MKRLFCFISFVVLSLMLSAERAPFMTNVYGRDITMLNGEWSVLPDIYSVGGNKHFEKNHKARNNQEFFEYSFDGATLLDVPGDWNSQSAEFKFYEGDMWYGRYFNAEVIKEKKYFLYFGGVSYRCEVFLNGTFLGRHEGSFTPFQFEVTDLLDEENFICLKVSNRRTPDAIPAMMFDWWNYGGITRDVMLVSTPQRYINEYFISLDKEKEDVINAFVSLSEPARQQVTVEIPELKISQTVQTDEEGIAEFSFKARKLQLWSPENPRLYKVKVASGDDSVTDEIGFRTIAVDGTRIILNGEPRFMKCVSFHEEIPMRMGRACTESDAITLISAVVELGANMARLAHYPQNEHIVRLAEKMGVILWEEIPLWQGIDFTNDQTREKAMFMYKEMLWRDKNRCSVCFWGIANETRPGEARNSFLDDVLSTARSMDNTRLFTIADDAYKWNDEEGCFELPDPFIEKVDVVGVNMYMGWYARWPRKPEDCKWNVAPGKPLIISEFGGESLYGIHGDADKASSWSEDYQADLIRDNLTMFDQIENLAGISPWVLFDFRSPYRLHPVFQEGWNRKGLLSDKGQKKKAWYVINEYYKQK